MTRYLRLLFLALCVAALGLTGCGGDDDDDDGADASAEVDADADADVDEDAIEDAAEAAGLGEGCAEAVAAFASVSGGAASAFTGGSDDLEDSLEAFEEYAEVAPEEIRAEMTVIAEVYGTFIRALAEADYDPASGEAPPQEVMDALEEMDSEELQEASETVTAYFESECGTDITAG